MLDRPSYLPFDESLEESERFEKLNRRASEVMGWGYSDSFGCCTVTGSIILDPSRQLDDSRRIQEEAIQQCGWNRYSYYLSIVAHYEPRGYPVPAFQESDSEESDSDGTWDDQIVNDMLTASPEQITEAGVRCMENFGVVPNIETWEENHLPEQFPGEKFATGL